MEGDISVKRAIDSRSTEWNYGRLRYQCQSSGKGSIMLPGDSFAVCIKSGPASAVTHIYITGLAQIQSL